MPSVTRSIRLPVAAAEVWRLIGEFGAVDRWMPGVEELKLSHGSVDSPGVERVVVSGGMGFVERLIAVNDAAKRMVYTMPDPPFPIRDHRATLAVTAIDDSHCTVTWTATFEASEDVLPSVDEAMGTGAFQRGLDALAERFDGRRERP